MYQGKKRTKHKLKVLFIGLGSIGQRHLQNFKELAPPETTIIAYRTSNLNSIIVDGQASLCSSLSENYNLIEYNDFDEVLAQKPDVGFICNPSNLHLETAIKLAEIGADIFIEKPLDADIRNLRNLESILEERKLVSFVGYQSRFHPALKEVKSIIARKQFGEVVSAGFMWHNYLPAFHSYEDYRKSYAARQNLGGGVTLGLSHELDLIQWFFGIPHEVYAAKGAASRLEVDVEDTIIALFKCDGGEGNFPVSLRLSYAQGFEQRRFSILTQEAVIDCDLENKWLKIVSHDKKELLEKDYQYVYRNDLFKSEMRHFLDSVIQRNETVIPISEGKKSLVMSLAIHKSIETGEVEEIKL